MVGKYDASHCGTCGSCGEGPGICVCDSGGPSSIIAVVSGIVNFLCDGCAAYNSSIVLSFYGDSSSTPYSVAGMFLFCTACTGGILGDPCYYQSEKFSTGEDAGGATPCFGFATLRMANCSDGKVQACLRVQDDYGGMAEFSALFANKMSFCSGFSNINLPLVGSTNFACNFSGASCNISG